MVYDRTMHGLITVMYAGSYTRRKQVGYSDNHDKNDFILLSPPFSQSRSHIGSRLIPIQSGIIFTQWWKINSGK